MHDDVPTAVGILRQALLTRAISAAQAKCTLGNETRLVPLMGSSTVIELMNNVRLKFPSVKPFVLKYLDRCAASATLELCEALANIVEHVGHV